MLIVAVLGVGILIAEVAILATVAVWAAALEILAIVAIGASIYVIGKPAIGALLLLLPALFAAAVIYCWARDIVRWWRKRQAIAAASPRLAAPQPALPYTAQSWRHPATS